MIPTVYANGLGSAFAPVLCRDYARSCVIGSCEILAANGMLYFEPVSPLINIAKVYELVGSSWVKREFRVSSTKLIMNTVPTGNLLVVPEEALYLMQLGSSKEAKEVFIRYNKRLEQSAVTVTALNLDDASPAGIEFAASSKGPYSSSITVAPEVSSFWIRCNRSKGPLKYTTVVRLSSIIYL